MSEALVTAPELTLPERQKAVSYLQIDLMKLSDQDPEQWIQEYSPRFREMVEREPKLLKDYLDENLRAATVRRVQELLGALEK
ncbi:MAG: hypothetical protein V1846_02265 [Candidatus Komeilibacteria bacterium]